MVQLKVPVFSREFWTEHTPLSYRVDTEHTPVDYRVDAEHTPVDCSVVNEHTAAAVTLGSTATRCSILNVLPLIFT